MDSTRDMVLMLRTYIRHTVTQTQYQGLKPMILALPRLFFFSISLLLLPVALYVHHDASSPMTLRSLVSAVINTSPTLTESYSGKAIHIRYWSGRWGHWLTVSVIVEPHDTVEDVTKKISKKSYGYVGIGKQQSITGFLCDTCREIKESAILYLDEIPLPSNKRLFPYWYNEIRNGGALEVENDYGIKKQRKSPHN